MDNAEKIYFGLSKEELEQLLADLPNIIQDLENCGTKLIAHNIPPDHFSRK
jgi:hypothetical protein